MDSGADCWFYSSFIGVPGGAVHDSSRRGSENVVFPLVLQCFSRDQSISQLEDTRQPWNGLWRGTARQPGPPASWPDPPVGDFSTCFLIFDLH